jgi:SAM-dependent methyltransferase
MGRHARVLWLALRVGAAVALLVGAAAAGGPAGAPQWNLDIERAMDAIGLAPGMIVGEAGAGDGYFTLPMARRVGPSGAVVANDIDARSLRSLEQRGTRDGLTNVSTVVGEVADPRFPREDLQMVVVVHALHDFSRPVEWLTNLKKYLRPGATLAVIDRDPEQGAGSHFWPRDKIIRYAHEAGYEMVKGVFDISDHLILVFKVKEPGAAGSLHPRAAVSGLRTPCSLVAHRLIANSRHNRPASSRTA